MEPPGVGVGHSQENAGSGGQPGVGWQDPLVGGQRGSIPSFLSGPDPWERRLSRKPNTGVSVHLPRMAGKWGEGLQEDGVSCSHGNSRMPQPVPSRTLGHFQSPPDSVGSTLPVLSSGVAGGCKGIEYPILHTPKSCAKQPELRGPRLGPLSFSLAAKVLHFLDKLDTHVSYHWHGAFPVSSQTAETCCDTPGTTATCREPGSSWSARPPKSPVNCRQTESVSADVYMLNSELSQSSLNRNIQAIQRLGVYFTANASPKSLSGSQQNYHEIIAERPAQPRSST